MAHWGGKRRTDVGGDPPDEDEVIQDPDRDWDDERSWEPEWDRFDVDDYDHGSFPGIHAPDDSWRGLPRERWSRPLRFLS